MKLDIRAWLYWHLPRLWMSRTAWAFWVEQEKRRLTGLAALARDTEQSR